MYRLVNSPDDGKCITKAVHYSNSYTFFRSSPKKEELYICPFWPSDNETLETICKEAAEWQILRVHDTGRHDGYEDSNQLVEVQLYDVYPGIISSDIVVIDGHFAGVFMDKPPRCTDEIKEERKNIALISHEMTGTGPIIDRYFIKMPVDTGIYIASYGNYERKSLDLKWHMTSYYLVKKP